MNALNTINNRARTLRQFLLVIALLGGLFPTVAVSAQKITGKYSFTESGRWSYKGDSGRFRDAGTAKVTRTKLVSKTFGRDGMVDKTKIRFVRRLDKHARYQVVDGYGTVKTVDRRGHKTYSRIAARFVVERLSDGRVKVTVAWNQVATRGYYKGAHISGEAVAWKK